MAVPISNVTRRVVFEASGTGPYSFTFEILANTDIAVYEDDTLLTLTTDYTVTINSNGTGSVTLVSSPTGDQIAIVGNRNIARTTDFVTGGDFFANTINTELDQQTIFAQQNAEGLLRALQAPQTDPTTIDMTLPRASLRANKSLAFDTDGNPVVGEQIGDYRGNWTSGTAYNKRDIVKDTSNSNIYYCATAHTASGSQPLSTNTDSAKWTLIVDAESAGDAQTAAEAAQAAAETAQAAAETAETNAETAETNAETAATAAASSASAASTSASNASTSASTASTAATNAGNSATSAATSATNASSSASSASTSASNASTSASSASTSATAAATSATNAASSATAASGSASTASTQATNAATSATNAASSETAAAASATSAAASFDSFDDRYLGAKSSDPSVDNDGNALIAGALYFNSTSDEMRVRTAGGTWAAAYIPAEGYLTTGDIGSTVQAYDADLTSWAALAPSSKQDTLVSGTSIKTINSTSLLGSGNITISASGGGGSTASGSVTLTSSSGGAQSITPSDYGQYVKLPDATTMTKAANVFTVSNKGTYALKVLNNSGSVLGFLYPGDTSVIGLADNSTAAGVWNGSNWDVLAVTAIQTYSAGYTLRDQIELDSTRTLFLLTDSVGTYGQVFDSSAATWGAFTLIRSGNAAANARGWFVSTDKALVVTDLSGTARSAVVLTFSGTTITVNTEATATVTSAAHLARITVGTTFVLVQTGYITAFTVSGTTVTVGSQTSQSVGTTAYAVAYTISSNSGLVITGTNATSLRTYAFTVSGTTFTVGTIVTTSATGLSMSASGFKTSAIGSQWIAVYQGSNANSPFAATIFSVSGTTVSQSTVANLLPNLAFNSTSCDSIYVSGNKAIIGLRTTNWLGFNIVTNTSGTASIGTEWTSSISSVSACSLSFTSGTTAYYTAYSTSNLFYFSADMSGSSPSITLVNEFYGFIPSLTTPASSSFSKSLQGSIGVGLLTYLNMSSYTPVTVVNATKLYSVPSRIYSLGMVNNMNNNTQATGLTSGVVGDSSLTGTSFWGLTGMNWKTPSSSSYTRLAKVETIT